jgi:hypothetical protein
MTTSAPESRTRGRDDTTVRTDVSDMKGSSLTGSPARVLRGSP